MILCFSLSSPAFSQPGPGECWSWDASGGEKKRGIAVVVWGTCELKGERDGVRFSPSSPLLGFTCLHSMHLLLPPFIRSISMLTSATPVSATTASTAAGEKERREGRHQA